MCLVLVDGKVRPERAAVEHRLAAGGAMRSHSDRDSWQPHGMAVIERLDFLGVPTQDPERSRAFYRDVLGMRPDDHAEWEQWAGDTCFGIWQPERQGMPFVAQKGNPWPLRCDDVAEMRAALEAKGVQFLGDTFDTGVCHMAIFADPDGNELMLHRRYAPYE